MKTLFTEDDLYAILAKFQTDIDNLNKLMSESDHEFATWCKKHISEQQGVVDRARQSLRLAHRP